jgi:hypothetical protein
MSAAPAAVPETKVVDGTSTGVCCPPGAPGKVSPGPYVKKGEELKLGDLPVYVSGQRGDVGIIVFQEVFGVDSGRLKQVFHFTSPHAFVLHCDDNQAYVLLML